MEEMELTPEGYSRYYEWEIMWNQPTVSKWQVTGVWKSNFASNFLQMTKNKRKTENWTFLKLIAVNTARNRSGLFIEHVHIKLNIYRGTQESKPVQVFSKSIKPKVTE